MTSTSCPVLIARQMSHSLQGSVGRPVHAVQALGEDPGDRRLADAPGAAEQVGVGHAVQADRVAQGLNDVILTDHVLESLGPVAPSDDGVAARLIGGRPSSGRSVARRPQLAWSGPRLAPSVRGGEDRGHRVRLVLNVGRSRRLVGGRSLGEPGRRSRAHDGDAYGCCVPALTRFASHHCPGPPRLTQTPALSRISGRHSLYVRPGQRLDYRRWSSLGQGQIAPGGDAG